MFYYKKRLGITAFFLAIFSLLLFTPASSAVAEKGTGDGSLLREKWTGDYDGMVKENLIRVLVPYSKTFYFLDGATQRGFTYESVKLFEEFINKRLKKGSVKVKLFIIPTPRDRLLPDLVAGYGDIAAGNLTITRERLQQIDFADPVAAGVDEIIVTSSKGPQLKNVFDLAGREVFVRKSSSYYSSLQNLNKMLKDTGKRPVTIVEVDEYLEDEDLLEMVNADLIPMIVTDSHKGKFWAQIFDSITLHPDIKVNTNGRIAWAIRKDSPRLKDEINAFVKTHKKGTLHFNIFFKRYLQNSKYIKNALSDKDMKRFNNTLDFFRKYGDQYDFDWLMLAALAYQESGLDQSKRSHVGAIGIMQVMPNTAADRNVGIKNIEKLENNIHAGTKYLRFMADRYFADHKMDKKNRWLFAFASYNAGPARVAKLRKEARQQGFNPDIWFNNVELIAAKRIGRETVQYVSNIYKYYVAYQMIVKKMQMKKAGKSALKKEVQSK